MAFESLGTPSIEIFGIPIRQEIDFGHLLTALTLLAGFILWIYTTQREWRRRTREDAESGALRLLLAILRERDSSINTSELRDLYNSDANRERRRAYCGRKHKFKSKPEFEKALYALDWEGKIDFVEAHKVTFRVDHYSREREVERKRKAEKLTPNDDDKARILVLLGAGLADAERGAWTLNELAECAQRFSPEETNSLLQSALRGADTKAAEKAAELIGILAKKYD